MNHQVSKKKYIKKTRNLLKAKAEILKYQQKSYQKILKMPSGGMHILKVSFHFFFSFFLLLYALRFLRAPEKKKYASPLQ